MSITYGRDKFQSLQHPVISHREYVAWNQRKW